MSSLRNATQRRQHRERAQPFEREKLGLLEKHKDYSLRAKDFAAKKARLRILRQKATDRNPDEFHFAMMSSRVGKDGSKVAERGNKSFSNEVVKLLKTQDAGYIRTMAMKARRERERLEEEIQLVETTTKDGKTVELRPLKGSANGEPHRHRVFVDSPQMQHDFNAEDWFDTDATGLAKSYNRRRRGSNTDERAVVPPTLAETQKKSTKGRYQDAEFRKWKEERNQQKKHDQEQQRRREKLEAVKEREKSLFLAEQELDFQRAQMNNSIGGVNKNGIKFRRRQRKR